MTHRTRTRYGGDPAQQDGQCSVSAILLIALAAGACGGEPRTGNWTGSVTDSAGIPVVHNGGRGLWPDEEAWTVAEELRIGSLEGDPDYQFGQVGGIGVTSDGRIAVLDAQAQHVRMYSADGEYLKTIGGPGSGPGELGRGGNFVLVGPGDTLLVPDLANQRMSRYEPDGTPAGGFPLRFENGLPLKFVATRTGILAMQRRPFALPGRPAPDSMDTIVRFAPDGAILDTIIRIPVGQQFDFDRGSFELFAPETAWEIAGDGRLLFGSSSDYRIEIHSAAGQVERVITMPFERLPITEDDQDLILRSLEQLWEDAGLPPQAIAQARNVIRFAEFYPAFADFQVGPGNTVWVQHVQSAGRFGAGISDPTEVLQNIGAREWDVFDGEGRFLGVVTMPERFRPRAFVGDHIYGVWRDELDVQYVVRLRIQQS